MGKLINTQAAQGFKRHRILSQRLTDFADLARQIVQEHQGALIYSGGDDVLALLPLDTVLQCAGKLAKTFRETLLEFAYTDQEGERQTPSLSAGIVIAHHLDLLHQVRILAKQAEDSAKALPNKNAFSVILSKRSGEMYQIAGRWGDLDSSLSQLIDFYSRGEIGRAHV